MLFERVATVIQLSLYPLFKINGILTAKECDAG